MFAQRPTLTRQNNNDMGEKGESDIIRESLKGLTVTPRHGRFLMKSLLGLLDSSIILSDGAYSGMLNDPRVDTRNGRLW